MMKAQLREGVMRVCVDAGHGGRDPGTVAADGTRECDIALLYAERIADVLMQRGHVVIMTRSTDADLAPASAPWRAPDHKTRSGKSIDLERRTRISNSFNADVFVSIHANAALNPKANGAWVLYDDNSRQGPRLAAMVFEELAKIPWVVDADPQAEVFPDHSPATGDREIWVLSETVAPAILIELGFLSNAEDLAQLKAPGAPDAVAQAVVRGLERWGQ